MAPYLMACQSYSMNDRLNGGYVENAALNKAVKLLSSPKVAMMMYK